MQMQEVIEKLKDILTKQLEAIYSQRVRYFNKILFSF